MTYMIHKSLPSYFALFKVKQVKCLEGLCQKIAGFFYQCGKSKLL